MPAQHIWVIVNGGSNADIAEAIFENKASAIGTWGDSLVNHVFNGDVYPIRFERPTDVPIYIDVTLTVDETYPSDGDEQVAAALVEYYATLGLGQDVIHSRHYTPINTVPGHTVDSLYIGVAASPTQSNDIPITDEQRATTATTYITVTSVNN